MHRAPAGYPPSGPVAHPAHLAAAALQLGDVDHVEGLEQGRGADTAEHARAALLEALGDQHAGDTVDAIGGERQRPGHAAAGIGERTDAEGPQLTVGEAGLAKACRSPTITLFPCAVHGVQPHAGPRGRGGEGSASPFRMPDPARARHHLGQDTAHLDDRAALQLYRQIARGNRLKRDVGDFRWRGLALSLNPATSGSS